MFHHLFANLSVRNIGRMLGTDQYCIDFEQVYRNGILPSPGSSHPDEAREFRRIFTHTESRRS